jgi:hypothetical protein
LEGFCLTPYASTKVQPPVSAHAYTEDQQAQRTLTQPLPVGEEIEQPVIGLFAELGWTTVKHTMPPLLTRL